MADSTLTNKVYTLTHSIANDLCKYQYPLSLRVPSNSWTRTKLLHEGMLYLLRPDGKVYNAQGTEVR